MSKINTNMAAVTALYHLGKKEGAQNQAIERISSGLRLNHALDDAAGASIVGRMTSQIKGLEAAMRNAADAISLTQTAEGALDEVSSILHRMRELSVQAANGVYSGQDRQAIQNEVGQIQIELSRIAQNSTFNAVKMLNGDFTNTALEGLVSRYKVFKKQNIRIGVFGLGIELNGLVNSSLYKETKYYDPVSYTHLRAHET